MSRMVLRCVVCCCCCYGLGPRTVRVSTGGLGSILYDIEKYGIAQLILIHHQSEVAVGFLFKFKVNNEWN